jgi:hypothetical protein
MSKRSELNLYIQRVQRRLRLDAGVRGAAVVAAVALTTTIVLTLILNAYAFPERGLTPARVVLFAVVGIVVCAALAWPLWRLSRARAVARSEAAFPDFEQRLTTFSEKEKAQEPNPQNGLFLELLAADTLKVADDAKPERLVTWGRVLGLAAGCVMCATVLGWLVAARPGAVGYGASLLWIGPRQDVPPIYDIRVQPGDAAVRRNTDAMVTAEVVGLATNKVNLFARYGGSSKWEQVAMQPQMNGSRFQFLFAALPENVEYYVQAGAAASKHFKFRVVDLPSVKMMQVTYHYPKWTGMQTVSEEQAGDLRALEGTDAALTVTMTAPLKDGMLVLDDGKPVKLTGGQGKVYSGTIHMEKDGAYHVAATDQGQQVRLSEDYFISTSKANPPQVAIDKPGGDYRASPIEEVSVGVKAGADFGLTHVSLHYSVNGGPEQTVNLLKQAGAKDSGGAVTLNMEDYKLQPGDVVSVYATAKDNHAEAKTDISFIQIDPFEREFSQSQQGGGGGGGGAGGTNQQGDIARREKELIGATWKQINAKGTTPEQATATGKLLSDAQAALKEQAQALSMRMQSRDLSQANEEFNSFDKDMQQAAAGMQPAADKLKATKWQEAMPLEQKVLQALLRAESTFRKIQVAFGQRGGGGGGGSGAGRDLASLFDLEMDTEKNQYETAQTASPAEQQQKKVDDALAKLDALAKRQEELAQQQGNQAQNFQQRWQQEMLRREAEQLQRELEQMQRQQGQQGQQSASGQQGQQDQQAQQGQQGQSGRSGQAGQSMQQSGQQTGGQQSGTQQAGGQQQNGRSGQPSRQQMARNSAPGTRDGGADPRVQQALDRLRAANDAMSRAGAQNSDAAQRAAQRLREATDLLGSAQKQQASGKLDSLGRETDRLSKEESAEAERVRKLAAQGESARNGAGGISSDQAAAMERERQSLAEARQQMSNDLERLQKQLRDTARELAPTQPGAASSLRDALNGMDQNDLTNLVQRTADWLREGVNPNSNGTEGQIASGLKRLGDQVHRAEQGAPGARPQGDLKGTQTAALDHVDRLRSELERLRAGQAGRMGPPGQNGQQNGRPGQQGTQSMARGQQGGNGQQPGQRGQGQQNSPGQQQGGANVQGGRGGQQQAGIRAGGGVRNGTRQTGPIGGEIASGELRGGGGGVANYNVDTGGQQYNTTRDPRAPQVGPSPADTERFIQQGIGELGQLRQIAKNDPTAQKQIDDLVKELQKLDPSRFRGNPEMVEALHAKVMNDVDKLELQLRRDPNVLQDGQVRTGKSPGVPAGYQDAVAEYYRRLGKSQ